MNLPFYFVWTRNRRDLNVGVAAAHPIREGSGPGALTRIEHDHRHEGKRVRFYEYQDAVALLTDFWIEVDLILKERSTEP